MAVVSGFGWDWVDIYEDDFTGSFEEVGGASKDVLKYAQTDVLSNAQCQQNYERRIRNTEICARVRQRDSKNHEGVCSVRINIHFGSLFYISLLKVYCSVLATTIYRYLKYFVFNIVFSFLKKSN